VDVVLDGVASLFGVSTQAVGDAYRLDDATGATIALAAGLPGGRERPCEIVTPPLDTDHLARLDPLLGTASELGFTVPAEAAVHLHLDAGPFRTASAFANVVRLFGHWRDPLRDVLRTNPACRRLAPLPPALLELVERPSDWETMRTAALTTGLTKFFDVNLTKVLARRPDRHTLEVRVLPGSIDARAVVEQAALVERLLTRCLDDEPVPAPSSTAAVRAAEELLLLAQGAR
jgi:hypothetical protein